MPTHGRSGRLSGPMGFRVAILMESSLEISRDLLRGIIHHVRASEPWTLDITPGVSKNFADAIIICDEGDTNA